MTREEAIECIEAIHVQMFNSGNSKWTEACDMAIEALKEPKQGEWIPVDIGEWVFRCSSCHDVSTFESKFCGNCGASMVKEGEAE